ncbi:MAG TPA: peptide deformylase [Candidatus Limiplasma sp.]|nr:peptide deformylase [Candidatus Limiplasma sp.]HRX08437.1 peptide deformylase [Candidatus Limiplasma sp.]
MAIRKIITIGDEKLRKVAKPVTKFNARLQTFLDDLVDTMRENNGAGLAAPQVGVLKRCCVVEVDDQLFQLVNPEIIAREGEQAGSEGCLSVPERMGFVKRPMKVMVKAQNGKGEEIVVTGEGLCARALCHEIDHLNGVLYVDIMDHEIFQEDLEDDDDLEQDQL